MTTPTPPLTFTAKFKVGDRVRVSASGETGRVASIVPGGALSSYRVVDANEEPIVGRYGRFQDHELEHDATGDVR